MYVRRCPWLILLVSVLMYTGGKSVASGWLVCAKSNVSPKYAPRTGGSNSPVGHGLCCSPLCLDLPITFWHRSRFNHLGGRGGFFLFFWLTFTCLSWSKVQFWVSYNITMECLIGSFHPLCILGSIGNLLNTGVCTQRPLLTSSMRLRYHHYSHCSVVSWWILLFL